MLEVVINALLYVAYNVAVVPAVLFCLHRQTRCSETFSSGALAGVAMTVPFALTLACLLRSPQTAAMEAEVPWLPLITSAAEGRAGGAALWIAIFGLVAGWTLIETAVGSIHALLRRGRTQPRRSAPSVEACLREADAGAECCDCGGGARSCGGAVDVRDHRPGRQGLRHACLGVYCPGGVAAVRGGAVPVVQAARLSDATAFVKRCPQQWSGMHCSGNPSHGHLLEST